MRDLFFVGQFLPLFIVGLLFFFQDLQRLHVRRFLKMMFLFPYVVFFSFVYFILFIIFFISDIAVAYSSLIRF